MAFGGSAFGQSSSSLFGNTQPSVFGAPAPTTSLFGSAATSAPALASSAFGQQMPSTPPLWGANQTAFGAQQEPQGSRAAKWQVSQLYDSSNSSEPGKYHSISAMHVFKDLSVEELRLQDYARGDKGGEVPPSQQQQPGAFGAAFGAQPQSAFGGGFGAPQTAGAFGATGSAFGAAANTGFGAAGNPGFGSGGNTGFGASGNTGFGASANPGFGASGNTGFAGGGNTGFGTNTNPGFGAAANTGFGASANTGFGSAQNTGFGAPQSSAFGASAFGGASTGFGASAFGSSAFGASSASAPLFGSAPATQPTGAGVFGSTQPKPATNLFGATSASLGATGAFGAPFAGGASAPQSAPSLFGNTSLGGFGAASGAASGGSLFGNTGASLGFGNTGSGLFGSGPSLGGAFGASSSGLFGSNAGGSLFGGGQTGFGTGLGSSFGGGLGNFGFGSGAMNNPQQQQQQQQQAQGPLQASLTVNPFGDSKLFSGAAASNAALQSGPGASVVNTAGSAGQSQPRPVSVVVGTPAQPYRRTRNSELLARQTVMRRRSPGRGWFAASPMRPWGEEGSVFNVGSVLRVNSDRPGFGKSRGLQSYATPWRTEEQMMKAANLKSLVIDPLPDDPVLQSGRSSQQGLREFPALASETPRETISSGFVTPAGRTSAVSPEPGKNLQAEASAARVQPGTAPAPLSAFDSRAVDGNDGIHAGSGKQTPGNRESPADEEGDGVGDALNAKENVPGSGTQAGDASNSPARFVPYSEFYRNQMSVSQGRPSLAGDGRSGVSPRGTVELPKCTNKDVYLRPSLEELSKMSSAELSRVEGLTIGREGMGEIMWLEPVDVRGLDLDDVVQIKPREVSVYPRDEDMPPVGQDLNKPAQIKLFGISRIDKQTKKVKKDASTAARMVAKLKAHCEREGLQFLGYDITSGTWTFQANSF